MGEKMNQISQQVDQYLRQQDYQACVDLLTTTQEGGESYKPLVDKLLRTMEDRIASPPKAIKQKVVPLFQSKQWDMVKQILAKLSDKFPNSHFVLSMQAAYYYEQQQYEQAKGAYAHLLAYYPCSIDGLYYSGQLALMAKEHDTAREFLGKIVKLYPDNGAAWYRIGLSYKRDGNNQQAIKALEASLKGDSGCPVRDATIVMADCHMLEMEYARALPLYEQENKNLENIYLMCRLAEATFMSAEYEISTYYQNKLLAYNALQPKDYSYLGSMYLAIDQPDIALQYFNKMAKLGAGDCLAFNRKGICEQSLGNKFEALRSFKKALSLDPESGSTYQNMIGILERDDCLELLPQMLKLEAETKAENENAVCILFAIAEAYKIIKEHQLSFDYYCKGNAVRKKIEGYTRDKEIDLFKRINLTFIERQVSPLNVPATKKTPIFIVGMPRSGTTLMEQIIASHSLVEGAGELEYLSKSINDCLWNSNVISNNQLQLVRDQYLKQVSRIEAKNGYFTDKMPLNFRWIGFILSAFPEAKIIHIKRDPMATIWSAFTKNFPAKGMLYSFNLDDAVNYYGLYNELMRRYERQYPGQLLHVDYEYLTENQEQETKRILDYIGLEYEPQCLDFYKNKSAVKTASLMQVRNKMYTGSSKAWSSFAEQLAPYVETLQAFSAPIEAADSAERRKSVA